MRALGAVVAVAISLIWGVASSQDFPCPQPTEQTGSNIKGEVDGKAQTFLRLGAAELKGNVEKTVVDLFSKYPNADKVAIVNTLMSTTCYLIRNSKQLTDEQKLEKWLSIFPILKGFSSDDKKSQNESPVPDLGSLQLTMQKDYADKLLGAPKTFRIVEVRSDEPDKTGKFQWFKKKEYFYRSSELDIRVIYDEDGLASSIFVGLGGDEQAVSLAISGDWPAKTDGKPRKWAGLTFKDVGDEFCDNWVNSSISAQHISITCRQDYFPPGRSAFQRQPCYFSAGYGVGAFDVRPVSNGSDLTDFAVVELANKGVSDEDIKKFVWNKIKDTGINYMQLTLDEKLVKRDWNN